MNELRHTYRLRMVYALKYTQLYLKQFTAPLWISSLSIITFICGFFIMVAVIVTFIDPKSVVVDSNNRWLLVVLMVCTLIVAICRSFIREYASFHENLAEIEEVRKLEKDPDLIAIKNCYLDSKMANQSNNNNNNINSINTNNTTGGEVMMTAGALNPISSNTAPPDFAASSVFISTTQQPPSGGSGNSTGDEPGKGGKGFPPQPVTRASIFSPKNEKITKDNIESIITPSIYHDFVSQSFFKHRPYLTFSKVIQICQLPWRSLEYANTLIMRSFMTNLLRVTAATWLATVVDTIMTPLIIATKVIPMVPNIVDRLCDYSRLEGEWYNNDHGNGGVVMDRNGSEYYGFNQGLTRNNSNNHHNNNMNANHLTPNRTFTTNNNSITSNTPTTVLSTNDRAQQGNRQGNQQGVNYNGIITPMRTASQHISPTSPASQTITTTITNPDGDATHAGDNNQGSVQIAKPKFFYDSSGSGVSGSDNDTNDPDGDDVGKNSTKNSNNDSNTTNTSKNRGDGPTSRVAINQLSTITTTSNLASGFPLLSPTHQQQQQEQEQHLVESSAPTQSPTTPHPPSPIPSPHPTKLNNNSRDQTQPGNGGRSMSACNQSPHNQSPHKQHNNVNSHAVSVSPKHSTITINNTTNNNISTSSDPFDQRQQRTPNDGPDLNTSNNASGSGEGTDSIDPDIVIGSVATSGNSNTLHNHNNDEIDYTGYFHSIRQQSNPHFGSPPGGTNVRNQGQYYNNDHGQRGDLRASPGFFHETDNHQVNGGNQLPPQGGYNDYDNDEDEDGSDVEFEPLD